jgi:formylglycine-generating enzyme required for sulfatase activity
MTKIFISYRRADSQDFTDRLFEYMGKHFGDHNVFQDVGDSTKIPLGVDFVEYIAEQISQCDIILVVIGEQWLRILQERENRFDDFVRIEVESALKQNKVVIPILKSGANMPNGDDLPASMQSLARRNASRVRPNPDFIKDCENLANGIRAVISRMPVGTPSLGDLLAKVPPPSESERMMPRPFGWCYIPTGKITLTNTWDDERTYIGRKGDSKSFDVPAFHMAKYPITNAQYALFVQAKGYGDPQWWTDIGWKVCQVEKWTQPLFWEDAQWNGIDYPVVGISWYEAVAFCKWLSATSNETISLPTEQHWQRSLQANVDGSTMEHRYLWGNAWKRGMCNSGISPEASTHTTPVTQYENVGNVSACGVVDLVGNVWEWCLTGYYTGNQTTDGKDARVLRGGSWGMSGGDNYLSNFRLFVNPANRVANRGFRVCRTI